MNEEKNDYITIGTAATGGAIHITFDFGTETKEEIERKVNFAAEMAQKLKIVKENFNVR